MSVQGKTALVTGSTSGIGLDCVRAGRRRRARDPQRLRRCGSGEGAGRAAGRPAGITAPIRRCGPDSGHDGLCRTRVRRRGHSDKQRRHYSRGAADQFPVEKWNAILAINLSAVFHTCRLALPGMRERNWGASSTWRRCTGWWRRKTSRPMWRPSMAWWVDQDAGAGDRAHARHLQRHLPRLGADAVCAAADRQTHCRRDRPAAGAR